MPPFDLLLTDLHLPGIKGDALVRTWQSHSPLTRTMLMSGDPDIKTIASACRADSWFRKPIDLIYFDNLVASVFHLPCAAHPLQEEANRG